MERELHFEAEIKANPGTSGGAYIEFPFDVEKVFGRGGRIKVLCSFDGIEYQGSLVKMGTLCHIVGLRKDILASIGKKPGDMVTVRIEGAKSAATMERRLSKAIGGLKLASKSPIAAYIEGFDGQKRARLEEIYAFIRTEAPGATEKISYEMPTFYLKENLVHFAAQARHLGFYPSPSGVSVFEAELRDYPHSKGAIQFPYDKTLPEALIRAIVRFRVQEVRSKG